MMQASAADLIHRARRWRAAREQTATPARLADPWTDEMSHRLRSLAADYLRAELPLTLQRAVVQVAAAGWNLSRCEAGQRGDFLRALDVDEAMLPMLLQFADAAALRWPGDPRFIVSAELCAEHDGIEVICTSLH